MDKNINNTKQHDSNWTKSTRTRTRSTRCNYFETIVEENGILDEEVNKYRN